MQVGCGAVVANPHLVAGCPEFEGVLPSLGPQRPGLINDVARAQELADTRYQGPPVNLMLRGDALHVSDDNFWRRI